jgi:alpha-ketoglutarate-dependent taurine dioxygenase
MINNKFVLHLSDVDITCQSDLLEIRNKFEEYSVLVIKNQKITKSQYVEFCQNISGKLHYFKNNSSFVYELNNDKHYSKTTLQFHKDQCFTENINKTTFLYCVQSSSSGAETVFSDSKRAYDLLSEETKLKIHNMKAKFSVDVRTRKYENYHNVVQHLNGVCYLFVERLYTTFPDNCSDLLEECLSKIEDPSIHYEHVWEVGDLVFWKNLCVAHARKRNWSTETDSRILYRCISE